MNEFESTTSSCSAPRIARSDCGLIDITNPEIVSAIMHKAGHEIGNPLTSIISLASIIARFSNASTSAGTIENKAPHYANSISSEAWKVSRLSDMLVMLFSKQAGSPTQCSVAEILERSLNKLKTRSNLNTDAVLAKFSQDKSPTAFIDSEQFTALLSELIANAIHASKNLSSSSKDTLANSPIVVSAEQSSEATVVEVRNVVEEKNPLELNTLFLPLVTTSQAQKSMGLGLSMSAIIAERFNGFIEIEEKSFGSDGFLEFISRVVLPFSRDCQIVKPESRNHDAKKVEATDGSKNASQSKDFSVSAENLAPRARVLVIEDQPVVASAIQKILDFYYKNKTPLDFFHLSGKEAIRSIQKGEQYQAILCDLNLEGINGRDVFMMIEKHQPILCSRFAYMTGGLPPQQTDEKVAIPCLSKPFEPEQLLNIVQKLFAS